MLQPGLFTCQDVVSELQGTLSTHAPVHNVLISACTVPPAATPPAFSSVRVLTCSALLVLPSVSSDRLNLWRLKAVQVRS
jgi:hypothetical protein